MMHRHGHVFQLADLHAKARTFGRIVVGINMCPRSFTAFEAIFHMASGDDVPFSVLIVAEDLEVEATMWWPDTPVVRCDLNVHVER